MAESQVEAGGGRIVADAVFEPAARGRYERCDALIAGAEDPVDAALRRIRAAAGAHSEAPAAVRVSELKTVAGFGDRLIWKSVAKPGIGGGTKSAPVAGGTVARGLGGVAGSARGRRVETGDDEQADADPKHIIRRMWIAAVLALFAQTPANPLTSIENLIVNGRHREALAELVKQPESFERRLLASKAYDGLGDAERAVAEAESALAVNPRAEAGHLQLGQIFLTYNTPQAALDVFTEALTIHPQSFLLHAGRGFALKDLLRYEEAEEEFVRCLKGRPGFSICFDGLATVYLHAKRYEDLRQAAEKQEKLEPKDYRAPYFLAVAQNGLDENEPGIEKNLLRALARNGNFAAAHALLGRVRLRRGAAGEAIESLERAVKLRPGYPPALLDLAKAYRLAGRERDSERAYALLREANEKEREGKPSLKYHRGQAVDKQ